MKVKTKIGSKFIHKIFTVKVNELVDAMKKDGYVKIGSLKRIDPTFEQKHSRKMWFNVTVDMKTKEIKFRLVKPLTKIDKFLIQGGRKP